MKKLQALIIYNKVTLFSMFIGLVLGNLSHVSGNVD